MNATVVHGDSIERHIKQIYFIQNDKDCYSQFSNLNVMPHSEDAKKEFMVKMWLEESIKHIESPNQFISEVIK